ncbi:MAG: FAD-dependent oxidoreductase [Proteobacteria bacterium]|nr:FAD-dependent oxidoreductase [Pseudomonadota bacterium]
MNQVIEFSRHYEKKMNFDVVVCGGGPAGIGAALSAARNGSNVAIIEKGSFLGGAATVNLVNTFAYGFHDKVRYIIGGIYKEIEDRLKERDAIILNKRKGWQPVNTEKYKCLLDDMFSEAGVKVFFHSLVTDVVKNSNRIDSVIVSGKQGSFAIGGKVFIDATGDADVSYHAGVKCKKGRENDGLVQPMTLMYMMGGVDFKKAGELQSRGYWEDDEGRNYLNATGFCQWVKKARENGELSIPRIDVPSIFTIPWLEGVVGVNFGRVQGKNPLHVEDISEAEIEGRKQVEDGINFLTKYIPGFENAYLLCTASEIGVRDTRRIVGLYSLTENDVKNQKQFEDVVVQSCYMIDIHQPDSEDTLLYKLPKGTHYDIPYRCLVPKSIKNLYATGRCISASYNALGSTRVQPVCMALGQAAGAAASICARENIANDNMDINKIQGLLTRQGAILK